MHEASVSIAIFFIGHGFLDMLDGRKPLEQLQNEVENEVAKLF